MLNPKLLTELIGTFFLVMVVAFTGNPMAIGAVLMVLVYGGGHISGGHFNPAVTLGVFLKGKISKDESLRYVGAQFVGAILAALAYRLSHPTFFMPQPAVGTSWLLALSIEVLFTFLLVLTVLRVAVSSKTKGNQYFGLAIGTALFVGATVGGPISGGAFNPAVGIAPWLVNLGGMGTHFSLVALYLLGPLAGAFLAAKVAEFE